MKYAVIHISGKQYIAEEGKVITIDKFSSPDKKISIKEILMLRDQEALYFGKPYIEGAKIYAQIQDTFKGDKVVINKYKSKVRYRRKIGFRPVMTRLIIDKIVSPGKKESKKA